MLKERVYNALNQQINAEIYSSYLYLAMSSFCENLGLPGAANWMKVQYQEEQAHAFKFMNYIHERGEMVRFDAIAKPEVIWNSLQEVFTATLTHEQHVTDLINNLADIAQSEKDFATSNFLQWFVTEQVEEEASVKAILDKLKLINGSSNGLFMLDNELASRVFVDPNQNNKQ